MRARHLLNRTGPGRDQHQFCWISHGHSARLIHNFARRKIHIENCLKLTAFEAFEDFNSNFKSLRSTPRRAAFWTFSRLPPMSLSPIVTVITIVNHCLSKALPVKRRGYVILSTIMRHNSLRDLLTELLKEICKDVETEPALLPLTGETLPPNSNLSDGARLNDVSCINLWSPLDKAFIDVRVFNPQAESNWKKTIKQMHVSHGHEAEKKTEYMPRLIQVEKGSLTAAVFSTSGAMGRECDKLVRHSRGLKTRALLRELFFDRYLKK